MRNLKSILDRFYGEYDFKERLRHDPIEFPHRYKNPRDIEVSAFIASSLAYGKVGLFKSAVERILSGMGAHPSVFLLEFRPEKHGRLFEGIKYRFNENEDLLALMFMLHKALIRHTSLETLFKKYHRPDSLTVEEGLSGFIASLLKTNTARIYGKDIKPAGLRQLLPSPLNGSPCKRGNLFLRWMVRDRDIDFGIWEGIPKNRLIIPLDTHIARISRCLGLTGRKSQDWKAAVEITESLKRIDPEDPLKYDFALCHQGISGICRGKKEIVGCDGCCLKNC
ncbi:MAG: TIGR02757 family protein [Nitrospirota bacterium]|nr:TIGR02757 family protein [Nitrospirota bacterium]